MATRGRQQPWDHAKSLLMKTHEAAGFLPSFGKRDRFTDMSVGEALNIAVLCLVAMLVLVAAVLALILYQAWVALECRRKPPRRVPHATR
jgi:hypothetical protein